MAKSTSETILSFGKVLNLIKMCAVSFYKRRTGEQSAQDPLVLEDVLGKCEESGDPLLQEFSLAVTTDLVQLSDLVGRARQPNQKEQLDYFVDSYLQSLQLVSQSSDEEINEFYLSLSYNLIRDLRIHILKEDKRVRKKKPQEIEEALNEADQVAASFCFNLY